MTATPTKRLRRCPPRMAASSRLDKAVNCRFIDPSQAPEIADSLHQSPMSSDTAATTEPGSKVAPPATDDWTPFHTGEKEVCSVGRE